MSACSCGCGWSGDSDELVSLVENAGSDDVSVFPNRCPECSKFVVWHDDDDGDDSGELDPNDPDGYPLLQCGCGWSGAMEEAHILGDGSEFVCPGCNEVATTE